MTLNSLPEELAERTYTMTRLEKLTFCVLGIFVLVGFFAFGWRVLARARENNSIDQVITGIAAGTRHELLVKGPPVFVASAAAAFQVQVNTATKEDFDRIPGIGKTLAERIVEFRNNHGIIHSISDFLEVRGMTPKKLESFTPYLSLATEASLTSGRQIKRLNLNLATKEDLDALPGIGPVLAGAILKTRIEKGGFRSIDDLQDVPGLGEATYNKFADLVEVR
ncbi:MAG: ComEA family DNA-binding protein [Candidatus Riflebacteria bacterium]|nr:ComEA family DNA-binding protein [Candidatus Riflebacteria bacterium]